MDPTIRSSFAPRSYDDFVPPSDWVREEGIDTLLMELPGYTKEQLKVQLDSFGKLRVSGERPLDGNRWQRFRKEFHLPENCNTRDIRAKFEKGVLIVSLPKFIPHAPAPAPVAAPAPAPAPQTQAELTRALPPNATAVAVPAPQAQHEPAAASAPLQTPEYKTEPTEAAAPLPTVPKVNEREAEPTRGDAERMMEGKEEEKAEYGMRRLGVGMKAKRRQLLVNIGVAVVVLAGIGIYVAYKLKKGSEAEIAHYEL